MYVHLLTLAFLSLSAVSLKGTSISSRSDSTDYNHWPAIGLMAGGLIITNTDTKTSLQSDLQNLFGTTKSSIDDYVAFAPSVPFLLYSLNGRRHDRGHHIRKYILSTSISLALTYGLKTTLNVRRPNGGGLSFPSGHTSFAFSTATVSYMIYKDHAPLLAWASYIPAAITGVMRITRNKHWAPDVVFGAGLGILSTQLTYRLFKKTDNPKSSKVLSNLHFDIGPGNLSIVYQL